MMIIPPKLKAGDQIRVLALSRSLGGLMQQGAISRENIQFAISKIETFGLKVSFGRWVEESNEHLTASPEHRIADFHEALSDPSVKAILAVSGGVGAIQMLDGIDFELAARHPKIICGYSDITYPLNAVGSCAGVVTYYGPNFTTFMTTDGDDYMIERFRDCLFKSDPILLPPSKTWTDEPWHEKKGAREFFPNEGWWPIQTGEAEGIIAGGNYWCLNMLQGTRYFPSLAGTILFLEHGSEGKATVMALDSALRALSFQPGFDGVRGLVLGRYSRNSNVNREKIASMCREIPALRRLPIVANCDFGHTSPMTTFPLGARCQLQVKDDGISIRLKEH